MTRMFGPDDDAEDDDDINLTAFRVVQESVTEQPDRPDADA